MNARELEVFARNYVRQAPQKAATIAAKRAVSDNAEYRAIAGAIYGALDEAVRCHRCGRRLEDPVSVERRIGPECITREPAPAAPAAPSARRFVGRQFGVGRLRGMQRQSSESPFVDVALAVKGDHVITGVADMRSDAFGDLFRDGIGAATVAFVDVDVAYCVDTYRDDDHALTFPTFTQLRVAGPLDHDTPAGRGLRFTSTLRNALAGMAGLAPKVAA